MEALRGLRECPTTPPAPVYVASSRVCSQPLDPRHPFPLPTSLAQGLDNELLVKWGLKPFGGEWVNLVQHCKRCTTCPL